jgi:hypothetical protein
MSIPFLNLEFQEFRLEDQAALEPFLKTHTQPLTGFTFHTLASWNAVYRYAWCFVEPQTLLISCIVDETGQRHLLQPVGELSAQASETVLAGCRQLDYPIRIFGVAPPFVKHHMDFVAHFNFREDRAGANYIYLAQELSELPGRKFQKKRNLVSQAQRAHKWSIQKLNPENIHECRLILKKILLEDGEPSDSLRAELETVQFSLEHFEKLGQQGLILYGDDQPAAFAVFEEQDSETVVIHIEKGLRSFKGVFQVINQETARLVRDLGYLYINREEDLGNEGLRQAKLSYNPFTIREAFLLCCPRYIGAATPPDCGHAW